MRVGYQAYRTSHFALVSALPLSTTAGAQTWRQVGPPKRLVVRAKAQAHSNLHILVASAIENLYVLELGNASSAAADANPELPEGKKRMN